MWPQSLQAASPQGDDSLFVIHQLDGVSHLSTNIPSNCKKWRQLLTRLSHTNSYDYAGSWDTLSGHQANLHLTNSSAVNQGNFSTAAAVEYYMSQSVPASSLVVGMPLYGRSFLNTKGIGQAYNGLGQGNWEPGIYDYKTIPMDNAKLVEDMKAVGAYTYNPSNQELITFDTPNTVRRKVKYIEKHGLGGVMWWESSGDKQNSDGALIPLAAKLLGKLDSTPNHLRLARFSVLIMRVHFDLSCALF
jgi:chitinase